MICSNPDCGREYKAYFTDDRNLCRICDMLQSGMTPTISTEATFQAKANGKLGVGQFHPKVRQHYLDAAREAGVSTDGKIYDGRLAAFPGDPQAWISGQDDAKRLVESRGWSADGDFKIKGPEIEPKKGPVLAPDLVEDLVEAKLEEKLGEDFVEAKGGVVERARDDVLTKHAPPAFYDKV